MKKSILILGPQGSGKTTKLKEILEEMVEAGHHCVEISFSEFIRTLRKQEKFKGKVLFIDEVSTTDHIECIVGAISLYSLQFVITSQLPEPLPEDMQSAFDVRYLPF